MTWQRVQALWNRVPPIVIDVFLVAAATLDGFVNHPSAVWEFALGLFAAFVLLFRRRFPIPVLIATLPALFVSNIFLAPEIALFGVAATSRRKIWPALGGLAVMVGQVVPTSPFGGADTPSQWALLFVYSAVFVAAPVSLGLLVRARGELVAQLDELTAGHQREQQLVTNQALAVERAHLAREMHDVVAHNVSLIALQAGALRLTTADPEVAESAATIRSLSVRTLDELRHMVGVLRAAGANAREVSPQPTLTDLSHLVASCGLIVDLQVDPDVPRWCSLPVERAIYRTVQEGLTNVNKHASGALVTVEIARQRSALAVTIANEPPSVAAPRPALPPGGHGLIGLRERTALLGGTLEAHSEDGGGFVLRATFPAGKQVRPEPAPAEVPTSRP